ncbi:leucine-rich repeat-containing protein 15-like [Bradysia coprophila]|uniref:leucine-rich repeat-containing protein 15-like n=1 Tax=Bradysia coprophila TaxID=38358 RepID=UPI00187DA27A|nr:leucine-rich repeat-containing protein 15-like [Bradysia coprophila]
MGFNQFLLKSSINIILLLICQQFGTITGSEVKCVSNKNDTCEVLEPINGNDASITVTVASDQDDKTIHHVHLFNVSDAIPIAFFQRFPGMFHAEIKPGVKTISQSDFTDAKSLRFLELKDNCLEIVPKEVFAGAIALEAVDLDSNGIRDVEDYAFSGATKLTYISLNKNNLTIIRRLTFAGATSLERLELQENQIEVVEEGAFDSKTLKELFFESNRVKQLPDNIFANTPNLDIAYFSSNGMTEIGRAFYNIKQLGHVAFRHSQLKDVDLYDFVKANPQLKGIYMEDTCFDFINPGKPGESFPNKLRDLYLTNNNISSSNFLEHLEAFKDLQSIDIAFNNITQIDGIETIRQKFPKLEIIMYPGNPLSCAWIESTPFDRKMFRVPVYHESEFNASDYSVVDGIYCKK